MPTENDAKPPDHPSKAIRSRRRFVVKIAFLSTAFATAILAWVMYQVHCFRCEREARAVLLADAHPSVTGLTSLASIVGGPTAEEAPFLDLSELWHGRLYVPIVHVSIGWTGMTLPLNQEAWDQLQSFHYLERLEISGCSIDPNVTADFSGFTHLGSVAIAETPFSARDIRTLARLPELQDAIFKKKQGIDEWLPSIAQLRHLRTLEIQGDVSDQGVGSLAGSETLESLSLESDRITSRMVPSLVRLRKLKFLSLSHSRIGDDGLRQLSELSGLTELHLGNSDGISDEGVTFLAALESLETLTISSKRITSKSAPIFARMRNLKQLALPNTQFDGEGLRLLAAIKGLMVLELKGTAVADIGPELRFPQLEYLGLQDTKLTDAGLRDISQSPKLRCLVIAGTRVSGASIETLAMMPSLMKVYAYDTKIDEDSAKWAQLMNILEGRRASEEDTVLQR